jgi:protein-tyrosine phosphatase
MHEIHSNLLWTGNAFDVREPRALFDAEIAAVVDLAIEESPSQLPRQLIYCRFPIVDGEGNARALLLLAVQTTVDLLASGTRTIVACSAGLSRSPTIATFALAAHLGHFPEDVLARLNEMKSLELHGALWNDVAAIFPDVRRRV